MVVRVLVNEKWASQTLWGEMKLRCLKGFKSSPCSSKFFSMPQGKWRVKREKQALKITHGTQKKSFMVRGSSFQITGSFRLRDKALKRLDLYFQKDKTHWVAHISVDEYLYGVLKGEVPVEWPMEALKAQAVAARTYFLFKQKSRVKEAFDVRSDIMDQVFAMDGEKHQNMIRAVDETHGEILVSQKLEHIFPAYYHADCGGRTSAEKFVWPNPSPHNQPVEDPHCKRAHQNNWVFKIEKDRLMAFLHQSFYLPKGVSLKAIFPRSREQRRAHGVDVLFSHHLFKRLPANDFRKMLGFSKLRSTLFSVSELWDAFLFQGRGFGHGVGMCQWGAKRWAEHGKDYRFILRHYYPKARLKAWEEKGTSPQTL